MTNKVNWHHLWKESSVSFTGEDSRGSTNSEPGEIGLSIHNDVMQMVRRNNAEVKIMQKKLDAQWSEDGDFSHGRKQWGNRGVNRGGGRGGGGRGQNQWNRGGDRGGGGGNNNNGDGGGKGTSSAGKRKVTAVMSSFKRRFRRARERGGQGGK